MVKEVLLTSIADQSNTASSHWEIINPKPEFGHKNGHNQTEILDQTDENLENALIAQYEPLVLHIIGRLRGVLLANHVASEDAHQEGMLGLIEAIGGYDQSIGEFLPYASKRIRGQILDNVRRERPFSRLDHKNLVKIRSFEDRFLVEHEQAPSAEELAQQTNIPAEDVRWLQQFRTYNISDLPEEEQMAIAQDRHPAFADPDPLISPENILETTEQIEQLGKAIQSLSCRQQTIIRMYYLQQFPFWKIGQQLGITESAAAQLQKRAIKRIRNYYQAASQQKLNGHTVITKIKLKD